MRILEKKQIPAELKNTKLLTEMPSLKACNLLIIAERDSEIIGAAGVGGPFNITALQIRSDYQKRGIGGILYREFLRESKKRNYQFLLCYIDDKNTESLKLHDHFGFLTAFRIKLSKGKTLDVRILIIRYLGSAILTFLRLFNTRFGQLLLGIILKLVVKLKPEIIGQDGTELPEINIGYIIKNFEKI